MTRTGSVETGITPTVRTLTSSMQVRDVLDAVAARKADAILSWIEQQQIQPGCVLIFGTYMTGAAIANRLCNRANSTVVDIYPHLSGLLNCRTDFFTDCGELPSQEWDLIVDTTGLGGVEESVLTNFRARALLTEDPCSDGSDAEIRACSTRETILSRHTAPVKGLLQTYGLGTKTSGTMSLTHGVLARAVKEACRIPGVLYSTTTAGFSERILFREQNLLKFQESLNTPALVISTLGNADADELLRRSLSRIQTRIIRPGEGT